MSPVKDLGEEAENAGEADESVDATTVAGFEKSIPSLIRGIREFGVNGESSILATMTSSRAILTESASPECWRPRNSSL